jgi:hypothetical protein
MRLVAENQPGGSEIETPTARILLPPTEEGITGWNVYEGSPDQIHLEAFRVRTLEGARSRLGRELRGLRTELAVAIAPWLR